MLQLNMKVARITLAAGAVGTVLTVAFAAQTPQRGDTQSATGIRTVGSVMQVMQAIVKPASDAVFAAGGEPPKDMAGWIAVEYQALALAESGNLLMIGNRVKDSADWMKMSRAMVDTSAVALKAAQAKDAAAMSKASDAVYDTCESCHMKYLKK
jgi:cytochrome c'